MEHRTQHLIRKHTMHLMGLGTSREPLPSNPTKEEIAACIHNRFGGPSTTNFRPDFRSPMTSPWNRKILSVFTTSFYATQNPADIDEGVVQREFGMHFRHLRWKSKNDGGEDLPRNTRRCARRSRRSKLLEYRTKGCGRFTQLDHLAKSLELLGNNGMSEDESDHESGPRTGNRTYKIMSVPWRSQTRQFLAFLELLDLLHMSTKFKHDGTPNPGNWPRVRVRSATDSVGRGNPVAGLPVNFYDENWLSDLQKNDPDAFQQLGVEAAIDLAIDPRVIQ